MTMKKKASQLDREIAEALRQTPRTTPHRHATIVTPAKEKLVALLMQRDEESTQIARDLLLEQGILHTGRVSTVREVGPSFSGPIHQVSVVKTTGGRLGANDPTRYWMVGTAPSTGDVIDFTITREPPPTGKTAFAPKYQLHPAGILGARVPESVIRRWIEKWWIE